MYNVHTVQLSKPVTSMRMQYVQSLGLVQFFSLDALARSSIEEILRSRHRVLLWIKWRKTNKTVPGRNGRDVV